jgi:hypothetical protein
MLLFSILSLLFSNAVTTRRDLSILFNRNAMIALTYCILHHIMSLAIISKGVVGLHGGLLQITNITQIFQIFLFFISIFILLLTSFQPGKVLVNEYPSGANEIFNTFYSTKLFNKMGEHLKIIEYPLILLFIISGAVFVMSTNDLVSIFLSIELQSYGLYILSTIYRNSELSTTGGLMYFLLGGLSSCFILLGSALLYSNSGTTSLDGLYVINSISSDVNYNITSWYKSYYLNFSLLIFSIGFLFKVGAAPFHFWSPAKGFGKSFFWVKFTNFGKTLELMVPSCNWKVTSKWTNYSYKVISQKNLEKEVGNRGSKSDMLSGKEQRVYVNLPAVFSPGLRCTLRGFERNLIIKIPSKQIIRLRWIITGEVIIQSQLFSTLNTTRGGEASPPTSRLAAALSDGSSNTDNKFIVLPWFITGFADAEGCFTIIVRKTSTQTLGWKVEANFIINLHKRDVELLKYIQTYFGGVGRISKERNGCIDFTISSPNQIITQVISHFDKYPLITQKRADYLLFKEAVMIMKRGEHLTVSGLQAIINLRATINKGLTPALIEAFPETVAVPRPPLPGGGVVHPELPPSHSLMGWRVGPQVENKNVQSIDPQWVAGFTSGDGSFIVSIRDLKPSQTPPTSQLACAAMLVEREAYGRVSLTFTLIQHSRDELLMKSLVDYFGSGKAYTYKSYTEFKCRSFADIFEKVIPFFQKYPILGVKSLDFADWCKVAKLINNKAHLTKEGFKNIKKIRAGMNKGRIKNF